MSVKIPANSYWVVEEFFCEQRDLDNSFNPVILNQRLVDKARIVVQGKTVETD
jgi:hypothetical protein